MKKSDMSLRVALTQWETDEAFDCFMESMTRLEAFDEFTLFTHDAHSPISLDVIQKRAEILIRRISALKKIASRVGINQLSTLGHGDEDRQGTRANQGRLMRSIDGKETPGNYCPRCTIWRNEYVAPAYQALAAAKPDFIWIDDDVRLENHGPGMDFNCFCDNCFAELKKYFTFDGTLDEFRDFFDKGADVEALRSRRLKMLQWNRTVISDFIAFIEQNVHAVDPKIVLGRMDFTEYWSADRVRQAEILRGPEKLPVYWRPGGYVYDDFRPTELLDKADNLGMIAAELPDFVQSIPAEIENFPYRHAVKSNCITCLESSVYCAVGCTGVALNIVGSPKWSALANYEELMLALKKQKPFNDRLVSLTGNTPLSGVWDGFDSDYFLGNAVHAPHWISRPEMNAGCMRNGLNMIGLPRNYQAEHACVAVLGATQAAALSETTLMALFAKGLYLDADAVDILNERGFNRYIGFRTGAHFDHDTIETSLPHHLNPEPFQYNIRQSFWHNTATALELPENAEVLTKLVDYHDNLLASCGSAVWGNELGGRIYATGYGAWEFPGYWPKLHQLHAIFRYLANDQLDAEVEDGRIRSAVWSRRKTDGNLVVCVLNISLDSVTDLPIRLQTTANKLRVIRSGKTDECITPVSRDDQFAIFRLPEFNALELVCLDTSIS